MNEQPKVTVITINYNCGDMLETTIRSVLAQSYPNLEYIVVDGGSTDDSLAIIHKYQDKIDRWVSEPDRGIYDAMNKGVRMASGEWVNFMNAGDWFVDNQTVEKVMALADHQAEMVYGDHEVRFDSFTKQKKALPAKYIWKHMVCSHQSLFTRSVLLEKHPFSAAYGSAGDYHFIYTQVQNGVVAQQVPVKVASFDSGGVSYTHPVDSYKQILRIVTEKDKSLKVYLFHYGLIGKQLCIEGVKRLLPRDVFEKWMKTKNKLLGKT
ncbi:glycosyltransferase family 2 protein [Rapidithrix thailandica]|uniref:Glycosyltransferase family 2 protein n=1 Tax=Rapidithrix thailandica TaxID=413964 RepID=A0AAW9RT09_9BACT